MIKMWVLILVFSGEGYHEDSVAVFTQEFNTLESCQAAMNSVVSQTNKSFDVRVKSSGCYLK